MAPKPPQFSQAGTNPAYPELRFDTPSNYGQYNGATPLNGAVAWQSAQPDWTRRLNQEEKTRLDEHRNFLEDAFQKAVKNNPNLHPATLDEMHKLKEFQLQGFEGQLRLPDMQSRQNWLNTRNSEYNRTYFPGLSAERKLAAHHLGNEMRGPGIFDGIASNFYDEKKGGVQWGGMAGAAAGMGLGLMLNSSGIGEYIQSWLGGFAAPVLMLAGAVLGSWGGRVATDMVSDYMKPKTTPTVQPQKTQQVGLQQNLDVERSPDQLAAAMERANNQPTHSAPAPADPSNPNPGLSSEVNKSGKPGPAFRQAGM